MSLLCPKTLPWLGETVWIIFYPVLMLTILLKMMIFRWEIYQNPWFLLGLLVRTSLQVTSAADILTPVVQPRQSAIPKGGFPPLILASWVSSEEFLSDPLRCSVAQLGGGVSNICLGCQFDTPPPVVQPRQFDTPPQLCNLDELCPVSIREIKIIGYRGFRSISIARTVFGRFSASNIPLEASPGALWSWDRLLLRQCYEMLRNFWKCYEILRNITISRRTF